MTKPSPAIVACGSAAAQSGAAGSLPRFRAAGSWRPTALVALLLACALLSAGFASHEHDEEDASGDHHHCVICCLRHHSPATTTTAPAPSAPDLSVHAVAPSCRRSGSGATLATQPTRGPPA